MRLSHRSLRCLLLLCACLATGMASAQFRGVASSESVADLFERKCTAMLGSTDTEETFDLPQSLDVKAACACGVERLSNDPDVVGLFPAQPMLVRESIDALAMRRIISVKSTAAITSCVGQQIDAMARAMTATRLDPRVPDDDVAKGRKSITAVAIDGGFRIFDNYDSRGDLYAQWSVIPGAVYGRMAEGAVLLVPAPLRKTFSFRIDELDASLLPLARRLTEEARNAGWTVTPEVTRFARIGAVFFNMQKREFGGGAAFFDANTREPIMLMYVDRPCRIVGTDDSDGLVSSFDLDFARAGLHWIRFARQRTNVWQVSVAPSTLPVMMGLLAQRPSANP